VGPFLGLFMLFGVVSPPTVDAFAPVWLDAHTVGFQYAQTPSYDHHPYTARDDGTGFHAVSALPDAAASPDGRHRWALDSSFRLTVDGTRITSDSVFSYGPSRVAWSPDSSRIAFADDRDKSIYVVAVDGSGLRRVHGGVVVTWLSAGELAVAPDTADGPVYAVHDDGTRVRLLATGLASFAGLAASPDGTQLAFGSFAGWAYTRGTALYVASTAGLDSDVRRISPDACTVSSSPTCLDGTDGPDRIVGAKRGDIIIGGAGDDVIHAGDGGNSIQAQWGNDSIFSGVGVDYVDGGGGSDTIRSGAGGDFVNPGPGRDVVDAGRGDDHIVANDGQRDVVDCGLGDDRVRADRLDRLRNCEHKTVLPPSP
jgi:RTX calcium-binding nonapeptide repeat (4 copies)/WD40-like Beta Propeller Repeat